MVELNSLDKGAFLCHHCFVIGPHWTVWTKVPVFNSGTNDDLKRFLKLKAKFKNENGCWFISPDRQYDYQTTLWNGKVIRIHILSAIAFKKFIQPKDKRNRILVCHNCNRKACFNPNHIYIGNDASNRKDQLKIFGNSYDLNIEAQAQKFIELNHNLIAKSRMSEKLFIDSMAEGII